MSFKVKGKWFINASRTAMDLTAGFWAGVGTYNLDLGNPKGAALSYSMAALNFTGARALTYLSNRQDEEWETQYNIKKIDKRIAKKEKEEAYHEESEKRWKSIREEETSRSRPKEKITLTEMAPKDGNFDYNKELVDESLADLRKYGLIEAADQIESMIDDKNYKGVGTAMNKTLDNHMKGELSVENVANGKHFWYAADGLRAAGAAKGINLLDYDDLLHRVYVEPEFDEVEEKYSDEELIEEIDEEPEVKFVEKPVEKKNKGIHSLIPTKPSKSNNKKE